MTKPISNLSVLKTHPREVLKAYANDLENQHFTKDEKDYLVGILLELQFGLKMGYFKTRPITGECSSD